MVRSCFAELCKQKGSKRKGVEINNKTTFFEYVILMNITLKKFTFLFILLFISIIITTKVSKGY